MARTVDRADTRPFEVLFNDTGAGTPPWERSADHRALVEQGLRLHRAFFRIRSPEVREAIINLVLEAANEESQGDRRAAATLSHGR